MEKVKVGFVGAGWMGTELLKRINERTDAELVALHEPNEQRGREILAALGLPEERLVADYEAIVNDPGIDAVGLASPNTYHGRQAVAAMQAGKHVFCEKPCATSFGDFCKQIELERANPGLVTFVDYILYFDTMENLLCDMVARGEFGTITQVQVNYRHPVNIAGDKVWKLKRELVGDAIGMGVIHGLFAIMNVMESQAKPVGVFATSAEARVRSFEPPPIWNILIRFDNNAVGYCFGNIDNGNGYDAYHNLFGTAGGFVFDSQADLNCKVRYWSEKSTGGKWIPPLNHEKCREMGMKELSWPVDTKTPDSGDVVQHQTRECIAHFIECVKAGKKSPLGFESSSLIAEIGWAAQISAETGNEVVVPLDWDMAKRFFESRGY